MDLGFVPTLALQLHRWLEKIDIEPESPIKLGQLPKRQQAIIAVLAYGLPYYRTVFLLNEALIILSMSTPSGECNLLSPAVFEHIFVDKLASVVRIQPKYWEGQHLPQLVDSLYDSLTASMQQWKTFSPATGDISNNECSEKSSSDVRPAMGYQIHLEESNFGILPVSKGTEGNLVLE